MGAFPGLRMAAPCFSQGFVAHSAFSRIYARDDEFQCEGLGESKGQPAWIVYLRHRANRRSFLFTYDTPMGEFDIKLKGRACISTKTGDVRGEFSPRAMPFLNDCRFRSAGELYHIMQRYGLPTRLLDWMEGLLMALFFAILEIKTAKKDFTPYIWMHNPWWPNEKGVGKRSAIRLMG